MDGEIESFDIEKLMLDPKNPRLPESLLRDQQSIRDYIAKTTSIEELMEAIAENGFFPGEPLIVIPNPEDKEKLFVVEGNRRLTAVQLILDPTKCSFKSSKIRQISENAKHKPVALPIVVRQSRKEVLPYLGFRHITGIKQWEPLAKARYIEQIYNLQNKNHSPSIRYAEVARTIGSRRDHIKRNLDALAVYKVMEQEDFYGIDGLDEESIKFSILSTAVADDRIGNFIGTHNKDAEEYKPTDPIENPSSLKKDRIKELTYWIYEKDAKGNTKLGESRNLRELSAVVHSQKALDAFRSGSSLKIAYQYTSDLTADFIGLLYTAENALTEASSMVATVNFQEDAKMVATRLLDKSKLIIRELNAKNEKAEDV